MLDVRIYNRPQLSRDGVRVEGNGMIRMPLIETEIQAACTTEGELAKEIATRYAKYYRNLQVDIFVKEYHSRQVAIIGAVNEQGRFQLQRRIRLLELLTYAKGPSAKAGQTINVVHSPRPRSAKPRTMTRSLLLRVTNSATRCAATQARIHTSKPGDVVTLPDADQVYVVGNVVMPLTIPLKEPITRESRDCDGRRHRGRTPRKTRFASCARSPAPRRKKR